MTKPSHTPDPASEQHRARIAADLAKYYARREQDHRDAQQNHLERAAALLARFYAELSESAAADSPRASPPQASRNAAADDQPEPGAAAAFGAGGLSSVQNLVPVDDYIASRSAVFPSKESWRWFERHHRAELFASGAMTAPTGRKLLDPVIADRLVAEVGRRGLERLEQLSVGHRERIAASRKGAAETTRQPSS